jgi:hypothetical protein
MSNFIPPNIIQTPDFAGLAKERIDRKRQEETNKNAFLDQFEQAQGLYLDGDRPAVQSAWDKVQSTIDMVAENDTPESRRQLKQVYADYAKVAGTAQVLADQHRTQVAAYKSDPTKYAMSGSDFFSWDEQFRTKTRSFDDMQSALDNPNVLPSSSSYALLNPYEQAQTLMGETANVASTFYDSSGTLDTLGLRDRVRVLAIKKITANPEAMERAIIWGATTANNPDSGFAGDGDGKINSLEELNMIKELPQEERQKYMEAYLDALVDDYMELTPGNINKQSDKKSLPTTPLSIQAAGGQEVGFITLPGYINTSFDYEKTDEISGETTTASGQGKITQIGSAPDGSLYVTIESTESTGELDSEGNTITRTVVRHQPATQYQVDKILGKYGNGYDLSGLTPPPPVEQAATEPEAAPAETPAEATTTETTDTTAVTIDPADDPINIFTDETTEEKPAEASTKENKEDDKSFAYADLDDKGKKAVQKLRLKQQLERGSKADRERAKNITFTEEENTVISNWRQTVPMRNGFPVFKDIPKNTYDIDTSTKPVEVAAEEAPAEATEKTEEKGRDYVVINGIPVYRDEYQKIAGTKSSRGTRYPDTLEEYAKRFGETVKNEDDEPLQGEEISETTVTNEAIPAGTRLEGDRSIIDVERADEQVTSSETDKIKEDTTKPDSVVLPPVTSAVLSEMGTSTEGDGKRDGKGGYNYKIYKDRDEPIGEAENAKEGVPSPVSNPSSTESYSYYADGLDEDFKWTPETVQKAFDRWNANVPVEPEVWIKVANKFGIPVELMIAMAAAEGSVGRGERQKITKNFFNWGNTTKGDNLPTGSEEQDKYNTYFKTWEDGLMTWADGLVRMYRPDSGDWSELWEGDDTFVTQRKTPKAAKGSRYATNKEYESKIKEILDYSFKLQFGNNYLKKD